MWPTGKPDGNGAFDTPKMAVSLGTSRKIDGARANIVPPPPGRTIFSPPRGTQGGDNKGNGSRVAESILTRLVTPKGVGGFLLGRQRG